MNIITCLKMVADPDIAVFDVKKNELTRLYPVLDPIGHQVLEEGLQLREKYGGRVTVVCLGDSAADPLLRHALHQGANDAIRFHANSPADADTWLHARAIAKGLSGASYDLILCGAASADTGNGVMPAALATHLAIPLATQIVNMRLNESGGLIVDKKLPQGRRETYHLRLPAVIGCSSGITVPRYVAPYSRVHRRGEENPIQTISVDLPPEDAMPLTQTVRITVSKPRVKVGINISALSMADRLKMMRGELGTKKEIYTGTAKEAARKILTQLRST